MTTIRSVAIVGAGQMGAGIAQAVAVGGYDVLLYDAASERVPQAQGAIAASLFRLPVRRAKLPCTPGAPRGVEERMKTWFVPDSCCTS